MKVRVDFLLLFDQNFDFKRFESLCFEILEENFQWASPLECLGGKGDEGVDIRGVEEKHKRTWLVQCKKVQKLSWSMIKQAIEKIDEIPSSSHAMVLMTTAEISAFNRKKFKEYVNGRGYGDSHVFDIREISSKVYGSKRNLLERYFGLEKIEDRKIQELRRRDKMKMIVKKKLFRKDLPLNPSQRELLFFLKNPETKFIDPEVIIVPIDDLTFPDYINEESRWFETNFHDTYINGIELWINAVQGSYVMLGPENVWQPINSNINLKEVPAGYSVQRARMIGRIPYSSIVHIQLNGDPINEKPVLWCEFKFKGSSPFISFRYILIDKKGQVENWPVLDDRNRISIVRNNLP